MRLVMGLFLYFGITACVSTSHDDSASWVETSNALAREYALDSAQRYPEEASGMGYREFDAQAMQLEDKMEAKDIAHLKKWEKRLEKLLAEVANEELKTDYQVLAESIEEQLEGKQLEEKYNEVAYCLGSRNVFLSLQSLINPQSPPERKLAAVDRFKAYVDGHGTFKPLLEACVSRSRYTVARAKKQNLLYPVKRQLEEYIEQSPSFVVGIEEMLKASGRSDWKSSFEKFKTQVNSHDKYLQEEILPKARTDYQLPKDYYAYMLKTRGIGSSPKELIAMAKQDYKVTYERFKSVAAKVAEKHRLKDSRPPAVIKFLKRHRVTRASDVEKLYQESSRFLGKTIKAEELVSLPETPLKIRLAGDAESKARPVPHLTMPPLIDNQGERPEFVVPTSSTGELPFDDFSYRAAALVLTAHEGRPGHDLQFSSMLDNGVSVIRARYAVNNVNIEGWGLYAEELIYPFLPPESQLVALQTRLWRVARAFLDPQIQLGQVQPEEVVKLFTDELGVSKPMALLEVSRYTYNDVGQAPSYYYGLKKIIEAKDVTRARLGSQFTEKCFNDAVLALGLLPVEVISQRLNNLSCAE